jgi:hypothetical protein
VSSYLFVTAHLGWVFVGSAMIGRPGFLQEYD